MTQSEMLYVSETVLASAFYFGVMGGVVGASLLLLAGVAFRAALRLFKGR